MNGGSVPLRQYQRATCSRRRLGVPILLGVGAIAVAILEVDPEVLDRLALQLVDDAATNDVGEVVPGAIEFEDARQRGAVWRVLIEGRERRRAQLHGGVRTKEMRAAVDGVHGLAVTGLARPRAGYGVVHRAEMFEDGLKIARREGACGTGLSARHAGILR